MEKAQNQQQIDKRPLYAWMSPYETIVGLLRRVSAMSTDAKTTEGRAAIIDMSNSIVEYIGKEFWEYEGTYDVRSVLSFFGEDVLNLYLKNPNEKNIIEEITYRLSLYHTFFGLTNGVEIFPEIEFAVVMLGGDIPHSNGDIAHAFGQALNGDNPRLYGNVLLYTFGSEEKKSDKYEWDVAFFRVLSLHLLWKIIPLLATEEVEDIIEFHTYEALSSFVPVQAHIKKYILNSYDVVDFAIRSGIVMQCLEKNAEKIPVSLGSSNHMTLMGLLDTVQNKFGEAVDPLKIQSFIKDLYKEDAMAKQFRVWLRDIMYIYFHIIDGYYFKEYKKNKNTKTEKEIHDAELTRLITAFFSLETGWADIAAYYSTDTAVALSTFLDILARFIAPNTEARVETIISFNEFLHIHRVLAEDVSLLEYDEGNDTMEWSFDW